MGSSHFMLLMPEIFLSLTAMGFLMVGVFQGNRSTDVLCWTSCISLVVACGLLFQGSIHETTTIFYDMLIIDYYSVVIKIMIVIGVIASLSLSVQYLYQERIAHFEYPVLVLFAAIGMMIMVSANNFLSFYMGLELQSLSLYVLAAFHRNTLKSAEAAAKYFIMGALSSGMLLFGVTLIYGYSGSLDFMVIREAIAGDTLIHPGFVVGMVFVLAAVAFKISAAPFHMWTPDVYQGAPTSVTAFFAIVPKVAAVAVLARLLYVPFEHAAEQWGQVLYFVSLASLFVGSFAGIVQNNIKRLFAYSSIGNMGYVLIGLTAGTQFGVEAVLVFLFIYMIMTAGVFTIIMSMRREGLAVEKISDLAGLSKNSPALAYIMALLMFSMSGIPPAAGFFGKLFIFQAAMESELYILGILGVLCSVVAAFYYLRIIKVMFFDEPVDAFDADFGLSRRVVLCVVVLFVVGFIFYPTMVVDAAKTAAESLF